MKNLVFKCKSIISESLFIINKLIQILKEPCYFEIHLSDHCNLNCIGCSHYSPLFEPAFCNLKQLEENVCKLSKIADQFETIRLLGGEPLLNPEIVEAFRIVRRYFKKAKIKLITNGIMLTSSHINRLPHDFWDACREYNITICWTQYPINIDYTAIEALCKSHGIITEVFHKPEQFKLFKLNENKTSNRMMYYKCSDSLCMQLVGNRLYSCSQSAYVDYLNKKFGLDFKHCKGDSITVDNISPFRLRWFRLRTRPFCGYCVWPRPQVDWKRSERKAEEWVEQTG